MSHLSQASLSRRDFLALTGASVAAVAASQTAVAQTQLPAGELTSLTLKQASDLIKSKKVTSLELTQACLARIDKYEPVLNAFITVTHEKALAQAREMDAEKAKGKWRGPLHGIPIALKDNIDTAGIRTTAASALFADRVPDQDAEVVRRLRAAGAIIIGKSNLDEFAIGLASTLSHFRPVHNPWHLDLIAGGSSGGSAAAVSANLCYGALGSDTGGSIRIPAAYCGVVGLKPTYGLVSTRGLVPLSWSLDHVGPMCRNVADTALLLSAIAGYDPQDSASVNAPTVNYAAVLGTKTAAFRLGLSRTMFAEITDPEITAALNNAVSVLRSMTAKVREIELPPIPEGTWVNVAHAEAYVFHAPLLAAGGERYDPVIRKRAEVGSTISARNYIEARRHVERLRRSIGNLFSGVDLIVAPTAYVPPITIEHSFREEQKLSRPPSTPAPALNIYGLPAISIPCGFTSSGLPVGLQIVGPHWGEARVMALGHAFEQVTEWHKRRPPLDPEPKTKL